MVTIEIKKGIEIGFEELALRLSQLNANDWTLFLEEFQRSILGKRLLTPLEREVLLLKQIKAMIPATTVRRLKLLQKKRHVQTLSPAEQEEILLLSDFIELKSAERVYLLSELAQLRQITVKELVKQLNIKTFYG